MLVIACLLFLTFETTKVRGWYFQPKTHVSMTNSLPNKSDLTVHCKSKDNDLGTHVIPFNKSYEIIQLSSTVTLDGLQITPTIFFDIYDSIRDNRKCNKCKHYDWNIGSLRPCMKDNDTKEFTICYDWKKTIDMHIHACMHDTY
ncbi:hypothetical protein F8388_026637 [Cannabis sativa]|uniref:S-protein homolog n=1 Tax=Cannabis sativa TaxID=3483 RepID=A0A7J6EAB0_CANSA|nr:hypothetical protein F8388_026637 [Cannabis sativa]